MRSLPTFAFALFCVAATTLAAADRTPLALGSPLPDFRLHGVDDREYTPGDFANAKALVVIFTSNHCPTAQLYESRIKQLVNDYTARGVAFVGINPNHNAAVRLDEMAWTDLDDSFEAMKIRARDHAFNFPYLDDGETQTVSEKFGAVATPHVFIFDQQRKLRFQGRIDDSEREALVKQRTTRDALDAVLDGREPPVTQTRVFGCSTKWREKAEDNRRWREKVAKEPVELARADAATLKALRENQDSGKVRMINVWATWCGPCVSEFPDLVEHHLRFRSREFELVTVAAEFPDLEPKVLKFLQKQSASTRNLMFGTTDKYALMEALDPEWNGALPHTLLIDPSGKVIYRETGAVDFLELRRTLLKALDALSPWPATGGE